MTVAGLPDQTGERWVRQDELAGLMGVSTRTIRNWTRQGLPHDTWGMRRKVYQLSRCVAWARARHSHGRSEAA